MKSTFKTKNYTGTACLAMLIAVVLFLVLYLGLIGGVITLLWNWLLVGLFQFPIISWAQGIGIALLLGIVGSFFKGQITSK